MLWALLKRFSRSCSQRSRSFNEDRGNVVNSITREPVKRFEPKLTQILITVERETGLAFQGHWSRSYRDARGNFMNSIDDEALTRFEAKTYTNTYCTWR